MEVTFPTDSDGFVSQECQSCGQRFKVAFGKGSDQPISCCPHCGFKGENCWNTKSQREYLESIAINHTMAPELKKLERQLKGLSKEFLKVNFKSELPPALPPPVESDDVLDVLYFPCCNETIKVDRHDHHFCIICGKEVVMSASESQRVFLSHKGVDKSLVIDFKETLDLLGYSPWLDKDAMAAGAALHREILQGMEDSCGVVFFITSSFKDEGYLETEINYAIAEKMKKGKRFAIVTLVFKGDDGNTPEVPKLLRPYVWKQPESNLDALREILRALPIAPGAVDWREGIEGVVKRPKLKTTSTDLSEEAKQVLKVAAANGGRIMHIVTTGGHTLQAGDQSMIPDQNSRTIAKWVGGLEDLQRRRYIKDVGHKGEVFEVTREGYEAAEEI